MKFLTTAQAAALISEENRQQIDEWQVHRLFAEGDLPKPEKFGNKFVILDCDIPTITLALAARGWLELRTEAIAS